MGFWDKAQDTAAAASIGIALYATVAATTPAELQSATIDNTAHMIEGQHESAAGQAMSEATMSLNDTPASQTK